jgi:hypothetical protein
MLFAVPTVEDGSPSAGACRYRVTVDLRGMAAQLQAFATARRMTLAASVRRAIKVMLVDGGEIDDGTPVVTYRAGDVPNVKVTLRLPAVHAQLLAMRARKADASQGAYVAGLLEGAPLAPRMPDRTQVLKALCQSTSNLAALSVDLHVVIRSFGGSAAGDLVQHHARLSRLEDVVGEHIRVASKLLADVRATRRLPTAPGGKSCRPDGLA